LIPKPFHKRFQLNNHSFLNVDDLLAYSKNNSKEIYTFLVEWFSEEDTISVKTSGSTAKPQKITLQKDHIVNSAKATGAYFQLKENTKALLCLPVDYIAGKLMLIRALTLGWQLDVVNPSSKPLKTTTKIYDFVAMVPLQVENSLEKLHTIKKLIIGGGAVSEQLKNKLQKVSTQCFATYGMTETITHVAIKRLNNVKSFRVKITNKMASKNSYKEAFYQTLPNTSIYKDQRNCLVIKNDTISNKVVFTNDVVQLISDTQFEWLGRFDNVINSGGVKLHPEKIEEKLAEMITQRFFVSGIFDEKLGEKLVLVIEDSQISNKVEMSLKESIKDIGLSKYEIPKEIYFVAQFIETETKKIQRKKTLDLIQF